MTTPHIRGDEELKKFLRQFPKRMTRTAVRKSMRKGAKVIQEELAEAAPQGATGGLARSIIVRANRRKKRGQISLLIGPNTAHAYKGRFAEFGTIHQPATPWVEPTASKSMNRAAQATRRDLARTIPQEALRLGRQTGSKRRR